jgi:hypothetical protein
MTGHGIIVIKLAHIIITGSFGILISSALEITLIFEDLKLHIESEFL